MKLIFPAQICGPVYVTLADAAIERMAMIAMIPAELDGQKHLMIVDAMFPKQLCSKAYVETDEPGGGEDEIAMWAHQTREKWPERSIGWWHTHPGMLPNPSGQDHSTTAKWGLGAVMVITNPQSGCTNAFVLDEGKLTGVTATYNLEVVWMYDRRPFQEKSYTYIPPYSPYKEPEQRTFPFTPALQSEAKEGKKRFVDSCDICNDALAPLKWNASLGLYLCSSCEARFRADAAGVKRESAAEVVSDEDNDPDLDNGWPCEYCGSTTVTTHYNANTYCHLCDACEELYKQNPDKMNDELGGWCGG